MVARPFKLHFVLLCGVVGYEFSPRATQFKLLFHSPFTLSLINQNKLTLLFSSIKEERPKQLKQRKDLSLRSGMVLRQRQLRCITRKSKKKEKENKSSCSTNQFLWLMSWIVCLSINEEEKRRKSSPHPSIFSRSGRKIDWIGCLSLTAA